MNVAKSLWASVQGDPVFMRRVNGWLTIFQARVRRAYGFGETGFGETGSVTGHRTPRVTLPSRGLGDLSDQTLLDRVARKDELALAELYDRHGRVAYGLAFRIVRDNALAEDAVQEGFLAVWRSAERFLAERAKPSTWILTLVHRRAVDLVRREQRHHTEPMTDASEPDAAGSDKEIELRAKRKLVQDALRRLPHAQREALELAYYGGYTQSQLAEHVGKPLGTVKSQMFSALASVRELLKEPELEEMLRGSRDRRGV